MRRNHSYYCLRAPPTHIFVLRAHPVRGETHNQRNTTGEVATLSTSCLRFRNLTDERSIAQLRPQ